ncbi:MAG TPA: acyltransferase [Flavobacteriaceae bacterium]|jgi:acetyltransferase-like isoleucine patch superfamily enzyme|nr:acyltransferase [Flavobacteriaceae bacterium]HBS11906.1 acyltransferase [Flavobacteriaceae bacterium]
MKHKSFFSRFLWILYNQYQYGYFDRIRKYIKVSFWKQYFKTTGENLVIHPSVLIRGAHNISIGNNVNINHGAELYGAGGLTIGNGSMIAYHVMIFTDSRKFKSDQLLKSLKGRIVKPVKIGEDVWIGAGALIMPGVIIANHAIIAAGSVVTTNISEWEIAGGNPAKKIGSRIKE